MRALGDRLGFNEGAARRRGWRVGSVSPLSSLRHKDRGEPPPARLGQRAHAPHAPQRAHAPRAPQGMLALMAAELASSALGFVVTVHWARRLGPAAFAHVEYAATVAAWLLVVVRGGVEMIAAREAARRPRLIHPLTEVLLGLKCACAIVGYGLVLLVAARVGPERGAVVAWAGMMLIPSAFIADIGPRASGRLESIALAQTMRALGYAGLGTALVRRPAHAARAAVCLVLAETLAGAVLLIRHAHIYGIPRPRWRRQMGLALMQRGAIASLIRFGRVSLYGADLLVLGGWAGLALGPYAAARRLVFALIALGLVVPGAVAPAIARAWTQGLAPTREILRATSAGLWGLALPASLGLALWADRWMPLWFGPSYRTGGPWLALIAARLPWLLSASLSQSALIACQRERWALGQVVGMMTLALAVVPLSARWWGPLGVGWSMLAVEAAGAWMGWFALRGLGVAPRWFEAQGTAVLGCLALAAVCWLGRHGRLGVVCPAAALAYGAAWALGRGLEARRERGGPSSGARS
jgi:O-antigen/teichoic acid export membrane protein